MSASYCVELSCVVLSCTNGNTNKLDAKIGECGTVVAMVYPQGSSLPAVGVSSFEGVLQASETCPMVNWSSTQSRDQGHVHEAYEGPCPPCLMSQRKDRPVQTLLRLARSLPGTP